MPYTGFLQGYKLISAAPAVGVIYEINDFISGHVRMRGRDGGRYPFKYLEMIDNLFGEPDGKTIEVCAGSVLSDHKTATVDMDLNLNPQFCCDGQELGIFSDNSFARWRCDPPYNEDTALKMYDIRLPSFYKLLEAGARVVKPGSLLFLLCAQNYQYNKHDLKRIGCILMTIVPNNEIRCCNIYQKK